MGKRLKAIYIWVGGSLRKLKGQEAYLKDWIFACVLDIKFRLNGIKLLLPSTVVVPVNGSRWQWRSIEYCKCPSEGFLKPGRSENE